MKKVLSISAIFVIILLLFCCCLNRNKDNEYSKGGRDMVAYFGDARYSIFRYAGDSDNYIIHWTLFDQKNEKDIDIDIDNYADKNPYVYTVGSMGKTKLNYKTGEIKQGEDLSAFSKDDQKIFSELERTKSSVVKK